MFQRLNAAFIVLLLFFCGCVISPRRDGTTTTGGNGTGQLYVVNQSAGSVLRFAGATALNGNVTPAANLFGSSTQLSSPRRVIVDAANNRLYIANGGAGNILVFENASTLAGNVNVAPSRAISSPNLVTPADVALDPIKNLLYVADNLEVAVFASASTANNSTTALHVIQLTFTPGAILVDANNDRLFIADPTTNTINVFEAASTANGSLTPSRTITGLATQLSQPNGMVIDGAGRLIVSNFSPPSISIYANAGSSSTSGNVTPVSVISGNNTTLVTPGQIALDPTTNSGELYVADPSNASVDVFSSITTVSTTINPQPNRRINGSSTGLSGTSGANATGVAIDTTH